MMKKRMAMKRTTVVNRHLVGHYANVVHEAELLLIRYRAIEAES